MASTLYHFERASGTELKRPRKEKPKLKSHKEADKAKISDLKKGLKKTCRQ